MSIMSISRRFILRALIATTALTIGVAGLAGTRASGDTPIVHEQELAAQTPARPAAANMRGAYGVWVDNGEIQQVQAMGLEWWISFNAVYWALGVGDKSGHTGNNPPGSKFGIIVSL